MGDYGKIMNDLRTSLTKNTTYFFESKIKNHICGHDS